MEAKTTPAMDRLKSSRQELESRFGDLRRSIGREIGWTPKGTSWAVPLAAFASGLALAAWLVARRRE